MQVQIIENKRLSEREINLLSDALRVSDKAFAEVYRDVSKLTKTCTNCRHLEFFTDGRSCNFRCLTHSTEIFLPKNAGCKHHQLKAR